MRTVVDSQGRYSWDVPAKNEWSWDGPMKQDAALSLQSDAFWFFLQPYGLLETTQSMLNESKSEDATERDGENREKYLELSRHRHMRIMSHLAELNPARLP